MLIKIAENNELISIPNSTEFKISIGRTDEDYSIVISTKTDSYSVISNIGSEEDDEHFKKVVAELLFRFFIESVCDALSDTSQNRIIDVDEVFGKTGEYLESLAEELHIDAERTE